MNHLKAGSRKARNRNTQIRRSFINAEFGSRPTPLASIVGGGRAGGVRLRLELALLWMGGGGDARHQVTFPARAWAELLDLRAPDAAGQRRVRDALDWLETHGLITLTRDAGRPLTAQLLREDGLRKTYVSPVNAPKSPRTKKLRRADWNVQLPPEFWSNGWVIALATPGLALLLILLDLERPGQPTAWVSPDRSRERYGLSEDTWTRGVAELSHHGLVSVQRLQVGPEFGWKRTRNSYALHRDRLGSEPVWAED